ncbi:hypothetical protein MMU07_05510 [Aquiflexum sp. LQ15W]|uniref:hypothetical protein n=1 Tax=Cognataquiflexum nitidum TaxID=2922272 RepID=UPI001F1438F9|nr:hypothetical protein [Cognataquiflexum nitidum]MCH6199021.1 hypothetical protein [Cognataquiflexum nitidum]
MAHSDRNKTTPKLRIIETVRDEKSINQAVKNGFKPLIKKVIPSEDISTKYKVVQYKETGEIEVLGDYRGDMVMEDTREFDTVIDWTWYYPYSFKSPFAAYLIPKDIQVGERVFIKDLIEDYVGSTWNQGDTFRLESAEAIWNGSDLEIQFDPKKDRSDFIG